MAKYWMHNGLLRRAEASGKLGGRAEREATLDTPANAEGAASQKMSRSQGAGGLRDLLARHGGERVRFFLVRTHYRSTILYSEEGLEEAGTALDKFYVFFERYERILGKSFYLAAGADAESLIKNRAAGEIVADGDELLTEVATLRTQFLSKMDDDFNTGGATSELFQLLSLLNRFADENNLEGNQATPQAKASFERAVETLRELAAILGLFVKPPASSGGGDEELVAGLMNLMIELRAQARSNKDFATADRIRDGLQALNLTIEDRKEGTVWRQG
jgi:cysteinyl-tRNA synthetase